MTRYDRDTVLDLWADGRNSVEIAARLKMRSSTTVTVIVRKARERGDVRAITRNCGPMTRRVGYLHLGLAPLASREARARGMTLPDLCMRVLETVFRDGLLTAVLDDAPKACQGPKRGNSQAQKHSPVLRKWSPQTTSEFASVQKSFAKEAKPTGASGAQY